MMWPAGRRGRGLMQIKGFLRQERGGVAILISLLLVVFGGMLAVAVDLGHVFKVKAELQRAADAGALAGVMEMFPSDAAKNCTGAISKAREFVQKNLIDKFALTEEDIEPEYGRWVIPNGPFQPSTCEDANAVKVKVKKGLNMWFASMIGVNAMTPSAQAVALLKIKEGDSFPFCIDQSRVPPHGTPGQIKINTQCSDFGCWTPFNDPNGKVKDYIDGNLKSPPLWLGKIINVKNGVDNSVLKDINDLYQGEIVTVPVIADGEHSGTTRILFFVKVKILYADPPGGGSGDKYIYLETLDKDSSSKDIDGGAILVQ